MLFQTGLNRLSSLKVRYIPAALEGGGMESSWEKKSKPMALVLSSSRSSRSTNPGTPNPLDDDGSMARAWQRHTGRKRQGRIRSRQASGAGSGVEVALLVFSAAGKLYEMWGAT